MHRNLILSVQLGQFTKDTSYTVSPFTSKFRYLPNVPYSVAKKLIYLANNPRKPWVSSDPTIGVLESHYYFAKLDSTAFCAPQNYKGQHQYVLGQSLYPAKFTKHESHLHLAPLTPGYSTSDDFGCDGDDTPHKPISEYNIPNVIVANRTFSDTEPDIVDLVFFDFIQMYILDGLRLLGLKYRRQDVKHYMQGGDPAMTELIQEWVDREWKGDC